MTSNSADRLPEWDSTEHVPWPNWLAARASARSYRLMT
jgi:hypothetical protein